MVAVLLIGGIYYALKLTIVTPYWIHAISCMSICSGFNGDVDIMKYLHAHGVNYDHINGNKRTALHKAAVKGNEAACKWLIAPVTQGGCGYNRKHMQPEKEGDTPSRLAATAGFHSLSKYLQGVYESLPPYE